MGPKCVVSVCHRVRNGKKLLSAVQHQSVSFQSALLMDMTLQVPLVMWTEAISRLKGRTALQSFGDIKDTCLAVLQRHKFSKGRSNSEAML